MLALESFSSHAVLALSSPWSETSRNFNFSWRDGDFTLRSLENAWNTVAASGALTANLYALWLAKKVLRWCGEY
jgi:hypothetical protein